jgi:hypothetical protein
MQVETVVNVWLLGGVCGWMSEWGKGKVVLGEVRQRDKGSACPGCRVKCAQCDQQRRFSTKE